MPLTVERERNKVEDMLFAVVNCGSLDAAIEQALRLIGHSAACGHEPLAYNDRYCALLAYKCMYEKI